MSTAKTVRIALVVLILVTALAYLPVRAAGFVYEDETYIRPAQQPITLQTILAPRGLTALSFRLGALVPGVHPALYHAQNVLLHLVTGLVVYTLARRMLSPPFAVVAAGIMWLHPIQTEAVAYVAGRAELIAAVGVAAALWALSGPVVTLTHVGVAFLAASAGVRAQDAAPDATPPATAERGGETPPIDATATGLTLSGDGRRA